MPCRREGEILSKRQKKCRAEKFGATQAKGITGYPRLKVYSKTEYLVEIGGKAFPRNKLNYSLSNSRNRSAS